MALQHQYIDFDGESLNHYYLCNYLPLYKGSDDLSKSLIRFKAGSPVDVEAWTECSILEMNKISLNKGILILRALSSDEMSTDLTHHTPLDRFATRLANLVEGTYQPDLLHKTQKTMSVKFLSLADRIEELQNVYAFTGQSSIKEILILDDILTTGTTMKEIIKAIREVTPSSSITLFTLASTDHQAVINETISLSGTSYVWEEEEWKLIAEPEVFYGNLTKLKSQILNDSF